MRMGIIVSGRLLAAGMACAAQVSWAEPIQLHITVPGVSVNRADQVTFLVPVIAKAETAAAAREANQKRIDEITAKLVAGGIDRGMIKLVPPQGRMGFVGNELLGADSDEGGASSSSKTAFSNLKITYGDPALTPRIRRVLEDVCEGFDGAPQLSLLDDRKAKDAAIANGLENARTEANAYAAALAMKVSGIRAVSNVGEMSMGMIDPDALGRMMTERQQGNPNNVTTRIYVSVDFELAPR